MQVSKKRLQMIENFQCPGCTLGSDTNCGSFSFFNQEQTGFKCKAHSVGTFCFSGAIAPGMPRGFDKSGPVRESYFLWLVDDHEIEFNEFNIPVWKAKHKGNTFMRLVSPRTNMIRTVVFAGEDWFDKIDCMDVTNLEMD